jgi:DNA-binding Lrp family transcriptional regulator
VLILLDYNYPDYEVMSQLDKLPCVIEVNKVEGPYDIVVKLSDNNVDTIKECIAKQMTRIKAIQSTATLMSE